MQPKSKAKGRKKGTNTGDCAEPDEQSQENDMGDENNEAYMNDDDVGNGKDAEVPIDSAGKTLLDELMEILKEPDVFASKIPCQVRNDEGKLVPGFLYFQSLLDMLNVWMVCGSVCKDWSSMNTSRSQLLGRFILPFSIMVGIAHRLQPKVFVHECTRQFDCSTLSENLRSHQIYKTLLEPSMFGWPVKRGRSYAALVRRDHCLLRPITDIRKFFTTCELGGEIFFTASSDEVR